MPGALGEPTGHVFRIDRARGPQWYAKYRLPDGRQVQKRIGPAWTEGGRPPAGYFTKRLAEAWLRSVLDEARRGSLPGMVRTGATFADAAAEWLRYIEHDRGRKPSTVAGYKVIVRSQLLPTFGELPLESITTERIERWIREVEGASYYAGQLTTPKSGKVRAVPLAPDVAMALAQLGSREHWVGDDDLVFVGEAGGHLDGSALRRRYKLALEAAGLRRLRFHDLRHTFGTRMIAKADIRRVQEWMGHADIQTTMRYLHYAPREEDAELVAEAFQVITPPDSARSAGTP